VVLWGGLVPPDLPLDRFQARIGAEPLRIIVGSRDAFVPREQFEAEERRLHEAGIPALVQSFEGGHRVDAGVLSQIAS
jgi:predicted esterase